MNENLCQEINTFGFATVPQIITDKQIEKLIECLLEVNIFSVVSKKKGSFYGVRNLLNLSPKVRELAESREIKTSVEKVLEENAKPVRAIFFDKTPEANWKVPWHQDLTIAVKEKRETDGFAVWTSKADVQHVQPPVSLLEKMLTMRIHLDDTDETNGTLKVFPSSHQKGRLSAVDIQNLRTTNHAEICCVKRGQAFLMRPLLVHSSSAGTSPKHRRVIHIEFSAETLPNGLEWNGS
jgi:ectoine hydroxylase-related dioxygenase (phytanoyl-CoA dioxygenase family)